MIGVDDVGELGRKGGMVTAIALREVGDDDVWNFLLEGDGVDFLSDGMW